MPEASEFAARVSGHVLISVLQRGRGKTSGAEVDHPFVHVWTLRDGRGTTLRSFADRGDAVRYAEGEASS